MFFHRFFGGKPFSDVKPNHQHIKVLIEELYSQNSDTRKLSFLIICILLKLPEISDLLMKTLKQPSINSLLILNDFEKRKSGVNFWSFYKEHQKELTEKSIKSPHFLFWRFSSQTNRIKFYEAPDINVNTDDNLLKGIPDPAIHICGGFFIFGIAVNNTFSTKETEKELFSLSKFAKGAFLKDRDVSATFNSQFENIINRKKSSFQSAISNTLANHKISLLMRFFS